MANALISLAVNGKQLLRLMNTEQDNRMVRQTTLTRLVVGSGTRAEDAIDGKAASTMFQFVKCVFPSTNNLFFQLQHQDDACKARHGEGFQGKLRQE